MNNLKHFTKQDSFIKNGIPHLYVMAEKTSRLEVYAVPVDEMETFLQDHFFYACYHKVPSFHKKKS